MSRHCKTNTSRRPASYRTVAASLIVPEQPVDAEERLALDLITAARREMWFYAEMENRFFNDCMNAGPTLAEGFIRLANESNRFEDLLRYQAEIDEQGHLAIEHFINVKTRQGKMQTEAKSAHKSQQTKTLPALETDPTADPTEKMQIEAKSVPKPQQTKTLPALETDPTADPTGKMQTEAKSVPKPQQTKALPAPATDSTADPTARMQTEANSAPKSRQTKTLPAPETDPTADPTKPSGIPFPSSRYPF